MQLAIHVLAAGACPDLSAFKPVVERATAVLLAAIGASILAVVVYAAWLLDRPSKTLVS